MNDDLVNVFESQNFLQKWRSSSMILLQTKRYKLSRRPHKVESTMRTKLYSLRSGYITDTFASVDIQ